MSFYDTRGNMQLQTTENETACIPTTVSGQPHIEAVDDALVEQMLSELNSESARYTHKIQRRRRVVLGLCIAGAVTMLLNALYHKHYHVLGSSNVWWIFFVFGSVTMSQKYRSLASKAATIPDPRFVGPLLEAYSKADKKIKLPLRNSITQQIQALSVESPDLLKETHRRAIDNILQDEKGQLDYDFHSAVILLLTQHADEQNLRTCEHLIDKNETRSLTEKLNEALPRIRAAADRASQRATLLRAAAAPVQPQTLLRPAAPILDVQPESLLRAVGAGGE